MGVQTRRSNHGRKEEDAAKASTANGGASPPKKAVDGPQKEEGLRLRRGDSAR